jgi:hypothetical protein
MKKKRETKNDNKKIKSFDKRLGRAQNKGNLRDINLHPQICY